MRKKVLVSQSILHQRGHGRHGRRTGQKSSVIHSFQDSFLGTRKKED